jgi:PiT family inorganic phosphate transporter
MALSTTHVATGSILGTGIGRKGAEVRWGVAGRMAAAWVITLPAAAVVGWICFQLAHLIPGIGGALVIFAILVGSCTWMFFRARKNNVDPDNVNAQWEQEPPANGEAKADDKPPAESGKETVGAGTKGSAE